MGAMAAAEEDSCRDSAASRVWTVNGGADANDALDSTAKGRMRTGEMGVGCRMMTAGLRLHNIVARVDKSYGNGARMGFQISLSG